MITKKMETPTYLMMVVFLFSVSDMSKKQDILRKALKDLQNLGGPAYYIILYESNDDSLIRQLQEIEIRFSSPLTPNMARVISLLMARVDHMERISLHDCGTTDEFLSIMARNMNGLRLKVSYRKATDGVNYFRHISEFFHAQAFIN